MPAERIGMRDAREVIRLKSASVSTHEIARRLGMARSTCASAWKSDPLRRGIEASKIDPLISDLFGCLLWREAGGEGC